MHRPKAVETLLGLSPSTRRRWSIDFGDYLSPTAGGAISAQGGSVARRYTDADVALLRAIQRELSAGRTVDEVLVLLGRGALSTDVVVPDNPPGNHHPSSESPMSEVAVPVAGSAALMALDALRQALEANTALQREVLAELRRQTVAAPPVVPTRWQRFVKRCTGRDPAR